MNSYIRDFLTEKVEDHCFTSHMHLIYSEVFTWFFGTCYAFFIVYFLNLFIYLAASGLSCSRWDLLLCCVDSSCGPWALWLWDGSVSVSRRLSCSVPRHAGS